MGKGCGNIVAACNVAKHEIVHVGIDASATALTAVIFNVVGFAICDIHLTVNQLVATKDYSGLDPPCEEQFIDALVLLEQLRGIFLHGKIECESTQLVVR